VSAARAFIGRVRERRSGLTRIGRRGFYARCGTGCTDYGKGVWKTNEPQWNYCRLIEAVKKHSFL
jgi:hypothetical protein